MDDAYVSGSAAWLTLSLINAGLAQSKQRSGLSWWLVSLFLGPLATLLIVAWPPGNQSEAQPRPGTMGRTQATILGIGVIVVVLAVVGLATLASSGR